MSVTTVNTTEMHKKDRLYHRGVLPPHLITFENVVDKRCVEASEEGGARNMGNLTSNNLNLNL